VHYGVLVHEDSAVTVKNKARAKGKIEAIETQIRVK